VSSKTLFIDPPATALRHQWALPHHLFTQQRHYAIIIDPPSEGTTPSLIHPAKALRHH